MVVVLLLSVLPMGPCNGPLLDSGGVCSMDLYFACGEYLYIYMHVYVHIKSLFVHNAYIRLQRGCPHQGPWYGLWTCAEQFQAW